MTERDLDSFIRDPNQVQRDSFIKYFMRKHKISMEEAEHLHEIYIDSRKKIFLKSLESDIDNYEESLQTLKTIPKEKLIGKDGKPLLDNMRNYIMTDNKTLHRLKEELPKYWKTDLQEKQLQDQKIKLIVHERIQNNIPLEEYEEYRTLYNPLEFIKITGPVKKELKELAEPYRDLINELITDNLQKLPMNTLLNFFTKHTNNTNELKGIYGLYLDMLAEKTNMEKVNIYLEHDLNYFKDRDITFNKEELDNLLPNVLIQGIPRPTNDFIIDGKRYTYSAYLLKLLKKKEPKEQKPQQISVLQNPFGNKIRDGKLKIYSKGLKKPTFWREPGYYEVDLMQLKYINKKSTGYILFMIGINTKYVFIFNLETKSQEELKIAIENIMKKIKTPIKGIKFDGESGLQDLNLNIETYSNSSPYSNHNRIVDRVIKTFRDALGVDINNDLFNDFDKVRQLRKFYNNKVNRSTGYTPKEMHNNPALEWEYIVKKEQELLQVKRNLKMKGLSNLKPNQLLQVSVTDKNNRLKKKQRTFDRLARFIKYTGGNAEVKFIHPEIEKPQLIPLYQCMPIVEDKEKVLQTFNYFIST